MQGKFHRLFPENTVKIEDLALHEDFTELLQNICLARLPLSILKLKMEALVILLRNLNQFNRLNNGSQIILSHIN